MILACELVSLLIRRPLIAEVRDLSSGRIGPPFTRLRACKTQDKYQGLRDRRAWGRVDLIYLLNAASAGVALLAIHLAARPASRTRSQSYPNATSVAALFNSDWLLILELLVASAAIYRLVTSTPQVDGLLVLVVRGIAALVMSGALILRADADDDEDEENERDLSVAAVLLDTIADAAAATGVAATGGIILATGGWYWLDPAVALAISVVVAYHAFRLIRKVVGRLRSPPVSGHA